MATTELVKTTRLIVGDSLHAFNTLRVPLTAGLIKLSGSLGFTFGNGDATWIT